MTLETALERVRVLEGKVTPREGRCLAELAAAVPLNYAIVEIGCDKAKSACYLGSGSRFGRGAPVYAVGICEQHSSPGCVGPDVFRVWQQQVASLDLHREVIPLRCESTVLGPLFAQPIGLLFIDIDQCDVSAAVSFQAWLSKIPPAGYLVLHDYGKVRFGKGPTRLSDEQVVESDQWNILEHVDSLVVAQRAPRSRGSRARPAAMPAAPSLSPTGAPAAGLQAFRTDAPRAELTYVDNAELERTLARRPPQYGLDLSVIVPKRNECGIFVDTSSPHYRLLKEKYRHAKTVRPLTERVDAICRQCPVGAHCRFPRLSPETRADVLRFEERAGWNQWCETDAWGGEVDFVYPYVAEAARGEELRYSIRSVVRNFLGTARVWVIGDQPAWYRGDGISYRRISSRAHQARLDRARKLNRVGRHRAITREFVWMSDDVYFLQPVTLQELRTRWRCGEMTAERLAEWVPRSTWEKEKHATWKALERAGRPLDDLASHLPSVYEKNKVRRLIRKYQLLKTPLVDDLLYLNEYAGQLPREASEILYREHDTPPIQEIRRRAGSALFLNHTDSAYTADMSQALEELFPQPTRYENDCR